MQFKAKYIGYGLLALSGAYLIYRRMNKYKFSKYPLLWDIVLKGESKTYNDYNYYTTAGLKSRLNTKNTLPFSEKLLTQMTIGEVIGFQSLSRSGIGQLYATGKYQVIPPTLIGFYAQAGLNRGSMYNEKNQTKIADALIDAEKVLPKYLNGKIPDTDINLKLAALDIATIWSSLGVPYNLTNYKGLFRPYNASYYGGDKASVSTEVVQEILRKQRNSKII